MKNWALVPKKALKEHEKYIPLVVQPKMQTVRPCEKNSLKNKETTNPHENGTDSSELLVVMSMLHLSESHQRHYLSNYTPTPPLPLPKINLNLLSVDHCWARGRGRGRCMVAPILTLI